MRSVRLHHALETGAFSLPDTGDIAVMRPRAGDDLSALPKDRVVVVTGFRPDHDAFAGAGFRVQRQMPERCAMAVVCVPRARALARSLLSAAARAVAPEGLIVIDGARTDGIDGLLTDLRKRGLSPSVPVAKAHGKVFTLAAGCDLADWAAHPAPVPAGPAGAVGTTFHTLPGVFSADGPDRGSVLLAAALPAVMPPRVADAGAGWGFLSAAVLQRQGVREVHLIEAEADALDCARRNITDPRAVFHWADVTTFRPDSRFDAVVSNPPFHTGRTADPGLGLAFIRAAAGLLGREGTLWMVANRHLPYERALGAAFKSVERLGDDRAFTVWRADRPVPPAARTPGHTAF